MSNIISDMTLRIKDTNILCNIDEGTTAEDIKKRCEKNYNIMFVPEFDNYPRFSGLFESSGRWYRTTSYGELLFFNPKGKLLETFKIVDFNISNDYRSDVSDKPYHITMRLQKHNALTINYTDIGRLIITLPGDKASIALHAILGYFGACTPFTSSEFIINNCPTAVFNLVYVTYCNRRRSVSESKWKTEDGINDCYGPDDDFDDEDDFDEDEE